MTDTKRDWRYCKCDHVADDHNPASLACYKCDCDRWKADIERSHAEMQRRMQVPVDADVSGMPERWN